MELLYPFQLISYFIAKLTICIVLTSPFSLSYAISLKLKIDILGKKKLSLIVHN